MILTNIPTGMILTNTILTFNFSLINCRRGARRAAPSECVAFASRTAQASEAACTYNISKEIIPLLEKVRIN